MPTEVHIVKAIIFSSSHLWMWELDQEEGWVLKNWCFELWCWRRLLSPLECKEIKPVNPKGNQPWILIGRTDAEAETPILWPPDEKSWLIREDPEAGKDWRQEEKGTTENEMARWHHRLDGHEFEQAWGAGDGQGGLACFSPWGHKKSGTSEWLNNKHYLFKNLKYIHMCTQAYTHIIKGQMMSAGEGRTNT